MEKSRIRSYLIGIGVFLLAKFKWALALLKLTKFGGTLISMGASLGAYALIYGWKFGVALVYLIFVHEMGHLIAAKRKGIPTSPAIFIPFVGALISMKQQPRDAATEAYLAYGGPLAGLISFLPAVILYRVTEDPFWALVIFMGALLNLFNLLPVSPLDGGRIVSVLSTKIWLAGLLALIALVIFSPSPILFLVILFGFFTWWNRARENYRSSVLTYEKEKLTEVLAALRQWPTLTSMLEIKQSLAHAKETASREEEASKGKWLIPFLQDDERLARDKARMDCEFAERMLALLLEWEHRPVEYAESDPTRPIPSELLVGAGQIAQDRIQAIDTELHRYRTYYVASASTKWKVLAAYLLLAAVLSLFMLYGHRLMELYR
ncbi:site-2 protease family protein [Cohnella silvisoli]|uniref:Site-2 protease family protein n=1 Tax=Cohnella silvisoli TaxID=2873699 RepID=A0ABV1KML0_9BACL|nr:site-2 protease family protein [Cohnella silvisoli]MCD9020345.1 site-2 protease family protein [Cohnella silvisoli]